MNAAIKRAEDREIIEKIAHSISIAEAMNECLWLGDRKHNTIYVNPVYEKTTGYSLKECLGKPITFYLDKKSQEAVNTQLTSKKITAHQMEATLITKKGQKIPILLNSAPTSAGGTISVFTNLTDFKALDQQRRIAEEIVRNTNEAIVILDKNRKIKLWNSGASKMFGYEEEEMLNKKPDILIPETEKETNKGLIKRVNKTRYIKNVETKRQTKTGKLIDVSLSVTKVTNERNEFSGFLVLYRDISQEKSVNTELQKRFEAIQDAYKELGIQKRQTDYLTEIATTAVSDSTLESLGKLIVSASCLLTKCDGAVLRLYNKEKNVLQMLSGLGVSKKWQDKNKIAFKNSVAEEALNNKRPIIIQDIDSHPRYHGLKLLKEHGFKTLILIPLIVEKIFVGSLSLYATDPAKFRLIETDFLEKFGKQCSIALFIKAHCHDPFVKNGKQ
ncbi:MAG: PAS domain S-box protein [Candidatus Peregrinibacteria bacterium]